MKTTLALAVVTCCVLGAVVALPQDLFAHPEGAQPRHPEGLIAGWPAKAEKGPTARFESTYPYARPESARPRPEDWFASWPAEAGERLYARPENARPRPENDQSRPENFITSRHRSRG